MKAVVKTRRSYGAVEVQDMNKPVLASDDEVIISVKSAAICGSDIHVYEYPASYEFMTVPVILGHECSGIIEQVGSKVTKFKPGDIVMAESNKYCGVCSNCLKGKTNICYNSLMTGLHIDGYMGEYAKVAEKFLHHVPKGLSFSEAAVAQACTISVHGMIDKTDIIPGDTVVVFGPGIVGQTAAQIARIKGAGEVFIVGTNEDDALRLPVAKEMGFKTINVSTQNISEEIKKVCDVDKVDIVVECSGSAKAFQDAIPLLKKGGQLTILGIYNKPFEVPVTNLVRNEIVMNTSYTSKWEDYEKTLELLARGVLNIQPLCREYPLVNAVEAFEDAIAKRVTKPVLII